MAVQLPMKNNCDHDIRPKVNDTLIRDDRAYLNGAKLGTPVADRDDTNATGRGVTALVNVL